jgi:hypothetical protein
MLFSEGSHKGVVSRMAVEDGGGVDCAQSYFRQGILHRRYSDSCSPVFQVCNCRRRRRRRCHGGEEIIFEFS